MVKLVMRRKGANLEATSQDWADLLAELPQGVDLNVTVTRARSLPQLGTYWGLLSYMISDGPEKIGRSYATKDELSDALQLTVGFVRQIAIPGASMTYAVPKSKSFTECSQARFNEYFNSVQAVLDEWCGYQALPSYMQWMEERKRGAA